MRKITRIRIGDYHLFVNADSYDEAMLRPVLIGGEYDRLIDPQPDDVWLDVGGHVGAFSLRYAPRVKEIHVYEPDRMNYALLLGNISTARLTNVTPYQLAITDVEMGPQYLYVAAGTNKGVGTTYRPIRGRERYMVSTRPLADELERTGANALKLDAEGIEYDCLMSLPTSTLAGLRELVMEYHFKVLRDDDWTMYRRLLEHLRAGFHRVTAPESHSGRWTAIVHASNR